MFDPFGVDVVVLVKLLVCENGVIIGVGVVVGIVSARKKPFKLLNNPTNQPIKLVVEAGDDVVDFIVVKLVELEVNIVVVVTVKLVVLEFVDVVEVIAV